MVTKGEDFIPHSPAKFWWGSKPPDRCTGLELLEELGIECKVGHPAEIRAAEPRRQKHDRRDAALLLKLQVENRFPSVGSGLGG
jgi:hypothetical protein